jgi:glycosyltransferase involved in cell wall biosynthesis
MREHIIRLGIDPNKISTNYNGTDLELAQAVQETEVEELREKYNLQGKRVVLYAGTFGRANDIPTLMQAAEYLAADKQIKFVFAGDGFYAPALQELARRLPNVLLLPPQPRAEIFKFFKLADIALVTFNNLLVLASNSPSKFYDSLACGTPVIVTNPGWTKRFVEKYNCGWYVPAAQPQALAQAIKELCAQPEELRVAGARGAAIANTLFDRQQLVKQVEAVLERVVQ